MPEPRVPATALLDDRATVERLDPQGLLTRIEALPDQCLGAWQASAGIALPPDYSNAREVVLLGMGGSAIAGEIMRTLALPGCGKPVIVVRGYEVPAFAGETTLAIACSHSGNTEETLSALQQVLDHGAKAVVVSAGGRLLEIAKERGLPTAVYRYDGEPRSAIGHQLIALLAIGERAGLLEPQAVAVQEAVAVMRGQRGRLGFDVPAAHNAAKQLAARLYGRLPVVIGAGLLAPAAYRWKTQFAENSKSWALCEELPELGHNTIVGFGLPKELLPSLRALFVAHPALDARLLRQYDAIADELDRAGVAHERAEAEGNSPLAQVLSAIYLGDYVSYYLALLNGVEPSPVAPIQRFKAKLAGA